MTFRRKSFAIITLLAMFMAGCESSVEVSHKPSIHPAGKLIDSARYFIEILRFDKASDILLQITPAEDSISAIPPDTLFLIWSLCGEVNLSVGSYDAAFDFYSKALKIAEMPDNHHNHPEIYMQLAGYFAKRSDSARAFQYLGKAKQLVDAEPGNFKMMATLYLRYARCSSSHEVKEGYLLKAMELAKKTDDKYLMGQITGELGSFYTETDRELSLGYFKRALDTWKEIKNDHYAMNAWLDIVGTNIAGDHYRAARNQLDSFKTAYQGAGPDYILSRYYKMSYHLNYKGKKYDSAFINLKRHMEFEMIRVLRDEKVIVDNLVSASVLRAEKNRINQKQQEISQQRKLHIPLFFMVSLFSMSAVAFVYYNRRIKRDNVKISEQHARISELYVTLEQQLNENSMMFREMHHRVKNNLTMLTGIFHFQINRMDDAEAIKILTETNARIANIALIHELVFARNEPGRMQAGKYLEQLGMHIGMYDVSDSVSVVVVCDNMMEADRKVLYQLGIIVNELMLNSVSNFTGGTEILTCTMSFEEIGTDYIFRYSDNRVGNHDGLPFMDEHTPGYHLIRKLAGQVDGRLISGPDGEPGVTIIFPG